MTKPNGPINFLNLFIMGQVYFQLLALLIAPLFAFSSSAIILATAWGFCTGTDFSPLPRAGTLITGVAFLYVLVEEVWDLTTNVSAEIEANFSFFDADNDTEAQPALERYRAVASWSMKTHRVFVRLLEATLIICGTILSAVGDLIALWISRALGIQ
ncbi:hypothetical protein ELH62_15350 [Rhizobium ruizarguesonis]|uniref:hypothetical protein n=1 Tax=Rhizobium ruizarguesonis TaxID=2081791 RepID=UPI001030CAF2|nr:hypothetical protein [Rhizobium ruizarguesonis]TBA43661.1 hypothetical protein ELH62_15350 [Rhizobium ruizarguesonis]